MQQIVGADEIAANPDGPGGGRYVDGEVFLNLVDDLECVAAFAVHLVAEGQDRQVAHPANLEQLPGLGFHALGTVDHHDGGIDGGEGAVGVFGKVAVTGGVDQIEPPLTVIVAHRGGGDGDAAFLFQLHVIGPGPSRLAFGADLTGHLDRAAEQQEFLGQRGLAGVGMRDDRKCPAAGNFGREGGAVVKHGGRVAEKEVGVKLGSGRCPHVDKMASP